MKTKQIRVDADVIQEIEKRWRPRDTPNTVLRRVLKLDKRKKGKNERIVPMATDSGG